MHLTLTTQERNILVLQTSDSPLSSVGEVMVTALTLLDPFLAEFKGSPALKLATFIHFIKWDMLGVAAAEMACRPHAWQVA